jgi:aspartyl-tRNA(Asn)/glutamyl-tRNA(Gln) amidotransferase subunit C
MGAREDARELVERIAELARLRFSAEELESFAEQFQRIVEFVQVLQQLELGGVEPLTHVVEVENALREDEPRESLPREEALRNAPRHDGVFLRVPKVIE